jgi:hypothetical protein
VTWLDDIELEMERGREAERIGNEGKVRTAARRAVGIAVTEYQRQHSVNRYGNDFMRQIRGVADDATLPGYVRESAMRLQARISLEFESPSRQPMADAQVIIEFFRQALTS